MNLEVYPCFMECRFSHGNLKDDNLKNLIKKFKSLTKVKSKSARIVNSDLLAMIVTSILYLKTYMLNYIIVHMMSIKMNL